MNDLGTRYYCGDRGFEQDFGKTVRYYDMAAECGNRQAQENLGYRYYYGRSVERDYKKRSIISRLARLTDIWFPCAKLETCI